MNYHDTEDHDNLQDEVASDLAGPLDGGALSTPTGTQSDRVTGVRKPKPTTTLNTR